MSTSFTVAWEVNPATGVSNTLTLTDKTGDGIANYPLQFARPFLQGAIPAGQVPQILINGVPAPESQVDVTCLYPDDSIKHAILAVVIPSIPPNGSVTLSFVPITAPPVTPLTQTEMLDAAYNFDALLSFTGTAAGATAQAISARTMLENGNYTLWTSGQVAQTIILADDTTTREYDIGFGDGFHPLRPRFYATFWPQTHQVFIRAVVENSLASEIEDVEYTTSLSLGQTAPVVVYSADLSGTQATHPKIHNAFTSWTKTFWLNGTAPPTQVNIDHNFAYLRSTRFLPNYDTALVPSEAGLAAEYLDWTNKPHDIYDGEWNGGQWDNGMGTAGARQEIAPYPPWAVLWFYTGDWRMYQMALGMADLAGAFPAAIRETVTGKRLSRDDLMGSSTGLGHTLSITDRPTIVTYPVNDLTYSYTHPADRVTIVGPFNQGNVWTYEGAHTPAAFYPQYLLTGDRWYLEQMYLWNGRSASFYNGASGGIDGRGPSGYYGSILGQAYREGAWTIRNRAECAFIAPDSHPEKHYFTYLVNDALARYEGMFGITGTPFDGTAIKNYGVTKGNFFASNGGPLNGLVPPLGNMESAGYPNGKDGSIVNNERLGIFATGAVGSFTAPWTHHYWTYAIGRLCELGFAAAPLRLLTGAWQIGMILDSGFPKIISMYEFPVEKNATNPTPPPTLSIPPGGYFSTWEDVITNGIPSAFLTGVGWTSPGGNPDLNTYFSSNLTDDGRPIWLMGGLAMMVDNGDPRALSAWEWFVPNVYQAISLAALQGDPKWVIVPRTDNNILPAQPTLIP